MDHDHGGWTPSLAIGDDRPRRGAVHAESRPIGRPRRVAGNDTRGRIIEAARYCFATFGYAATSNRMIAERANLTTAAVYHHFGRKPELMTAVHRVTQLESDRRMRAAIASEPNARGQFMALIGVILATLEEQPNAALFEFVARDEARRHPELEEIGSDRSFDVLFREIVEVGIATGEIAPEDARVAQTALTAMAFGLAGVAAGLRGDVARAATVGCQKLLLGELFNERPNLRKAVS